MTGSKAPHLWLRAETKKNEHRTALTPSVVKSLLEAGFQITVEKSQQSIFDINEFAQLQGVHLVNEGSWTTAPKDAYIIGLKDLPVNDDSPLSHQHIMFGHCYKYQEGWKELLSRFDRGRGTLLDLEFLQDAGRVAAFGYYAGFAGSALAIDLWAHQQFSPNTEYPPVKPFKNEAALIESIKDHFEASIEAAETFGQQRPTIMVMGALGRCGKGAVDCLRALGIPEKYIIKWDIAETAHGGPFKEILDCSIFVNCIYLGSKIPPFLDRDLLDENNDRKLTVICDVSCDISNPNNPLPIYNEITSFDKPVLHVPTTKSSKPLDIIAIDHLPTLLPREASQVFSHDLLPTLLKLKERDTARVWTEAEDLYKKKVQELHQSSV